MEREAFSLPMKHEDTFIPSPIGVPSTATKPLDQRRGFPSLFGILN